jgi:hypothetical protein
MVTFAIQAGCERIQMINWQITAKTVYCESAGEEVTIIIKKDWSVQCTGYLNTQGGVSNRAYRLPECEEMNCARIKQYVIQLKAEEGLM